MKKILLIASLIFIGCTSDEIIVDSCKTITDKKIIYESIGTNIYAPKYYFFLEGKKTEVIKDDYNNHLKGQEYCK